MFAVGYTVKPLHPLVARGLAYIIDDTLDMTYTLRNARCDRPPPVRHPYRPTNHPSCGLQHLLPVCHRHTDSIQTDGTDGRTRLVSCEIRTAWKKYSLVHLSCIPQDILFHMEFVLGSNNFIRKSYSPVHISSVKLLLASTYLI